MNYADIHTHGDVMVTSTCKPKRKPKGFILPSPTMIMAGVIVALSLSNVILFKLYRSTADEYSAFRAEVAAQQEILAANAEKARLESGRVSAEAAAKWAAARDYWSKHPRIVRVSADSNPGGLRAVPAAAKGFDVPSVEQGFSTVLDVAECETRINGAVLDAAQLMHLQAWVQQQSEIQR